MPKPRSAETLCNAAIEGKAELVEQQLAKGADPNGRLRECGWTALSCAVMGGSARAVRALLDAGADPNGRDAEDGTTPLAHLVVARSVTTRTFKIDTSAMGVVSFAGILPDATPGETSDPREVLRLLVDRGADPNARDDRGRTILMRFAIARTSTDIVQALIEQGGADVNAVDSFGVTARLYARASRHLELERYLAHREVSDDGWQNYELLTAAHRRDLSTFDDALQRGANPNFWDVDENVLYWACASGSIEMVQRLFEAGADPFARGPNGSSPLFPAVESGNADLVKLLLDRGVTATETKQRDHTLLELATSREHAAIVRLLGGDAGRLGLAHARGLATTDVDEVALLVRGAPDSVASAFAGMKALTLQQNVRGKRIRVTDPAFVVFRLAGHAWTVIEALHGDLAAADAEELAKRLRCEAIFIAVSDTAGVVDYALFDGPTPLERLTCDDADGDASFTTHDGAASSRPVEDAFGFASQRLERLDAYLPGWSEGARRVRAGETAKLSPFTRKECPDIHAVIG